MGSFRILVRLEGRDSGKDFSRLDLSLRPKNQSLLFFIFRMTFPSLLL